jgi:ATP-dependent Clp protease protease subunit
MALGAPQASTPQPSSPQTADAPPPPKTSVIRFYAPVREDTVAQLLNIVDAKIKDGNRRIILLISSPGGSVFAGLTAYHYLKGVPAEVITHNFGEVDSIATVIYCAGSKRYSVPEGRFLMHGVTANFAANVPLDEGSVGEQLKLMQLQVNSIASVIATTVKKPVEEVQAAISKRTLLNVEEAQKWGLVQDVRTKMYDAGADLTSIAASVDSLSPKLLATKKTIYTTEADHFSTQTDDMVTSSPQFFTIREEYFTRVNPRFPKLGW